MLLSKEFKQVSKLVIEEINLNRNLTKSEDDCKDMTPDVALKFMKNLKLILKMLLLKKGEKTNDEERFVRTIFTMLSGSEANDHDHKVMGSFLGVGNRSVKLRFTLGREH